MSELARQRARQAVRYLSCTLGIPERNSEYIMPMMVRTMIVVPAEEMLGDEEAEPPHGKSGQLVSRRIRPEGQYEDGTAAQAGLRRSRQGHQDSNIGHLAALDSIVYSIHSLPHARPSPVDWCESVSPSVSHFPEQVRTYTCGVRAPGHPLETSTCHVASVVAPLAASRSASHDKSQVDICQVVR